MRFIIATLSLALASQAIAQQPMSNPVGAIEGTVLHSSTSAPIGRAQISLRRVAANSFPNPTAPGFAADTDAAGKFELAHIEAGAYTLEVQRSGFVTQEYKGQLTVTPGSRIKSVDFKLIPQAVVTGRVLEQDGSPLAGMEVLLLRPQSMNGTQQLLRIGSAQTSDTGEFRIANLKAGRYLLSATNQNGYQAFLSNSLRYDFDKPQIAFAKTFFPSAPDEAGARHIDLTSGQTLSGLEIRMKQERVFRIRGKIAASIPTKDLRVVIAPRTADAFTSFPETREATLNPDGSFEIARVFPGAYNVLATMASGSRSTIGRTQLDVAAENVNNLIVNKIEAHTMIGSIRSEGFQAALDSIRVFLSAPNGSPSEFGQVSPDASGAFRIENVTAEKLRLRLQDLPNGFWLKSITAAGRDILNSDIDARSGPIEITLASGVGSLAGAITTANGQPVSGSRIYLAPNPSQPARPDFFRNATSDQNGRFHLANLAPGHYSIYATLAADTLTPPARSKAQQVVIGPSTQQQIDITLTYDRF